MKKILLVAVLACGVNAFANEHGKTPAPAKAATKATATKTTETTTATTTTTGTVATTKMTKEEAEKTCKAEKAPNMEACVLKYTTM